MYAATGRLNVKWGAPISNGGAGHHLSPPLPPALVAGDLNKTISFLVGILSTPFSRALLGLIHKSPSCPMQLRNFLNIIHIGSNVF